MPDQRMLRSRVHITWPFHEEQGFQSALYQQEKMQHSLCSAYSSTVIDQSNSQCVTWSLCSCLERRKPVLPSTGHNEESTNLLKAEDIPYTAQDKCQCTQEHMPWHARRHNHPAAIWRSPECSEEIVSHGYRARGALQRTVVDVVGCVLCILVR